MAHLRSACLNLLVDKEVTDDDDFTPGHLKDDPAGFYCNLNGSWSELFNQVLATDTLLSTFIRSLESCSDTDKLSVLLDELASSGSSDNSGVTDWSMVSFAAASLHNFVRLNWTSTSECETCVPKIHPDLIRSVLVEGVHGESLDVSVRSPELLCLARILLCANNNNVFKDDWVFKWWKLRTLVVHFKVISQHSYPIYDEATTVIDTLAGAQFPDRIFGIRCAVEISLFYSHYFESAKAESWMDKAAGLSSLEITSTGALGKRTYFQRKDTNHFVLDIRRTDGAQPLRDTHHKKGSEAAAELTNVRLTDETRRDRIEFAAKRDVIDLCPTEQCVMMGLFSFIRRSEARTQVSDTKLYPHLEAVLDSTVQLWAIKLRALLERSKLESGEMKTVERALQQVEGLVQSLRAATTQFSHRMDLIYSSGLTPSWEVEGDLVKLYLSLGLTKAALDVALKLEMWETVIDCYHRIELRHKAAEVIQNKINRDGETAKLLCMLGDATEDEECYRKALVLSGNKSSRAFKSLGLRAYAQKDYPRAIELFSQSISINKFQLSVLSRLGYAAMQLDNWKVGAKAYREYCSFDSESFEAWNNLARCYVMLSEHEKAWNIFQEAAKRNYDNWQIWDNVLTASAKCGHFDAVLKAYHRILDIRDNKGQSSHPSAAKMKEVADDNILGFLGKSITSRTKDSNGEDSVKYLPKTLELCARIATHSPKNADFYQIYSKLLSFDGEVNTGRQGASEFRAAQMLQKGCAVHTSASKDWTLTTEGCMAVADYARDYGDACLAASQYQDNKAQSVQQIGSAKMSIRSIFSLIQKRLQNCPTDDKLKEACVVLESKMNQMAERSAALKS